MFNAVRMDIYRLIHTKSAYVILVIAMALAIAMSGMTALVRSMAAESIVETTDEVTMVSESGALHPLKYMRHVPVYFSSAARSGRIPL